MRDYKGYKVPDTYEEINELNDIFNPEGIRLEKVQYIDFDKMDCTIVTVSYADFSIATGDKRKEMISEYIDIVTKYIDVREGKPEEEVSTELPEGIEVEAKDVELNLTKEEEPTEE